MRRRLIKQKTAYTITLPIKWIRDHNLGSQDELEVVEEKSGLLIKTEKRSNQKKGKFTLRKRN